MSEPSAKNPIQRALTYIRQGVRLRRQLPGLPAGGPVTPALTAMQATRADGSLISPVGAELARLITPLPLWVLFVFTGGAGAVPIPRWVILDAPLNGPAQGSTPSDIGLVAHELTHVLQRELADPEFWPTGYPRLTPGGRRFFDSTNYMEIIAYLVGWMVEYDFLSHHLRTLNPPESEARFMKDRQERLRNRITTLSQPDLPNAVRLILSLFPTNRIYRTNYHLEARRPGGRVPQGNWQTALSRLGFSGSAVEQVAGVAKTGGVVGIPPEQFPTA